MTEKVSVFFGFCFFSGFSNHISFNWITLIISNHSLTFRLTFPCFCVVCSGIVGNLIFFKGDTNPHLEN